LTWHTIAHYRSLDDAGLYFYQGKSNNQAFDWKKLVRKLVAEGYQILNYPPDVPLPQETDFGDRPSKGLASVGQRELHLLWNAINSTTAPLHFVKVTEAGELFHDA
jgi:hypothetical protein